MNDNTGHGHVRKRPDGMKARCGGPRMCKVCQADALTKLRADWLEDGSDCVTPFDQHLYDAIAHTPRLLNLIDDADAGSVETIRDAIAMYCEHHGLDVDRMVSYFNKPKGE